MMNEARIYQLSLFGYLETQGGSVPQAPSCDERAHRPTPAADPRPPLSGPDSRDQAAHHRSPRLGQ